MDRSFFIYDKRWYFRLVPRKAEERFRARGLLEDWNLNDISDRLVVCYMPTRVPSKTGRFCQKDGSLHHLFAVFDSYLEFYVYSQLFLPEDRSFFEIIVGEFSQKPHFDIDIKKEDFELRYPGEDFEKVATKIRNLVIMGCLDVLSELKVEVDISKDVLIYNSHGAAKKSFHLVINNKCHENNREARAFYDAVVGKVASFTEGKYTEFVDKAVYSPRQQFRIVYSRKPESDRVKKFQPEFTYKDVEYKHVFGEDVSDMNRLSLVITQESLVSFTAGCSFIPSLVQVVERNFSNVVSVDLDEVMVSRCMKMLKEKLRNDCPFSLKEVNGHIISLKREAPSFCPICNRKHQGENPYMFVLNSKVYWDCRRSDGVAKKFFVGYITIDDIVSVEKEGGVKEIEDDGEEFGGDCWGKIAANKVVRTPETVEKTLEKTPEKTEKTLTPDVSQLFPVEARKMDPLTVTRLAQTSLNAKEARKQTHVDIGDALKECW